MVYVRTDALGYFEFTIARAAYGIMDSGMNVASKKGFTIIEVLLFFGVTSLMIAGMFIALGSSIGNQRYKDAVESFKSVLQQQYSDVINVYNNRDGVWTCQRSGANRVIVSQVDTSSPNAVYRGQSSCDVVGRYVVVNGGAITSQAVLALREGDPSGDNDVARMRSAAYSYGVTDIDQATHQMEWGTSISWPTGSAITDGRSAGASSAPRSIAILIVRSPESGGVFTFTNDTPQLAPDSTVLKAFMNASVTVPGMAERLLCVNTSGMVTAYSQGVYIGARAADSSAIRTSLAEDFGAGERC